MITSRNPSVTVQFTVYPLIPSEDFNVSEFGQALFSKEETISLKNAATVLSLSQYLSARMGDLVRSEPELANLSHSSIAPVTYNAAPGHERDFLSCSGLQPLRNADGDEFVMRVRVLSVQ